MPQTFVGQKVRVNLEGLQASGISISGKFSVSGVITEIDVAAGTITVQLDVTFRGLDVVTVTPERVTPVS